MAAILLMSILLRLLVLLTFLPVVVVVLLYFLPGLQYGLLLGLLQLVGLTPVTPERPHGSSCAPDSLLACKGWLGAQL